jgi:hypothetical protein
MLKRLDGHSAGYSPSKRADSWLKVGPSRCCPPRHRLTFLSLVPRVYYTLNPKH